MKKFELVIEKYTKLGVSFDSIEYAISAVKDGTKREMILESLTADYRKMDRTEATSLLEDIYKMHGGEFKTENKSGYLVSISLASKR